MEIEIKFKKKNMIQETTTKEIIILVCIIYRESSL